MNEENITCYDCANYKCKNRFIKKASKCKDFKDIHEDNLINILNLWLTKDMYSRERINNILNCFELTHIKKIQRKQMRGH